MEGNIEYSNISSYRETARVRIKNLTSEFRKYSASKGLRYDSDRECGSALLRFIGRYESEVILNEGIMETRDELGREEKVLSRFIYEKCREDSELYECLNTVVTGYALQETITLSEVTQPDDDFGSLEVYLDSGFLFGLLGYEGKAHERAYNETVDLLEETGADPRCFETTVDEMTRILRVYEDKIDSVRGRSDLNRTAITRYMISNRLDSGDVKEIIAMLEENIEERGVIIVQRPQRVPDYTLEEDDLYEMLGKDDRDAEAPISDRVDHDVDCAASVLTLRRRDRPEDLDSARAVFASTSSSTVSTIKDWYHSHDVRGISPALMVAEVSNRAWLKRPSAATNLKTDEMVALCYAALQPSEEAWKNFMNRLQELVDSDRIDSDEKAAIVASEYTDHALSEAEEESDELDESTLDDVIFRVRKKFEKEAETWKENARRQEDRLNSLISLISKIVGSSVYYILVLLVSFGVYLMTPSDATVLGFGNVNTNEFLSYSLIVLACMMTILNLSLGFNIDKARKKTERLVEENIRSYV